MTKLNDIIEFGTPVGRLTVLFPESNRSQGHKSYFCLCSCGNICTKRQDALKQAVKRNRESSCGCAVKERMSTHGLSKHELYGTHQQMLKRCYSPKSTAYSDYGGRGIEVCERWKLPDGEGFLNFLADMGPRPENYTLDRINNNGNYEPSNCKWSSGSTQIRNRRKIKDCSSKYKGVSFNKLAGTWTVTLNIGHFNSEEEAARTYDEVSRLVFGTEPNKQIDGEKL